MKSYKIEIHLSDEQKIKLKQMQGTVRYLYNEYIETNKNLYELSQLGVSDIKFMSGMSFDKYVNNTLSKQPNMSWIKECGSKSRKKAIMNAELAYKNFFKLGKGFPKWKKRGNNVSIYLPANNKTSFKVYRHKIKIPIFKEVLLKEFGYIKEDSIISSATISKVATKYYISILTKDENKTEKLKLSNSGVGLDLGIKETVVCSDGVIYKNINKTDKIKKIEKKMRKEQRALSRKFESLKIRKKGGETVTKKNIEKNILSVQKINAKLARIRTEYIRFIVNRIIKTRVSYIVIEDLNLRGMMKNRHLSKAIQQQKLYYFRQFLIQQCKKYGIEVRIVSRWFPSSKTCNNCGQIKKDLRLSDRIYKCNCGYEEDRDLNASYNLRDCNEYKIA